MSHVTTVGHISRGSVGNTSQGCTLPSSGAVPTDNKKAFISGLYTESCAFLASFTSDSNPLHGCKPRWKAKDMSVERLMLRKLRHGEHNGVIGSRGE